MNRNLSTLLLLQLLPLQLMITGSAFSAMTPPANDNEKYIHTRLKDVRSCYEAVIEKNPKAAGRIEFAWTIEKSGQISNLKVLSDTMNNPTMTSCIKNNMSLWVFPKPRDGKSLTMKFPFSFQPQ